MIDSSRIKPNVLVVCSDNGEFAIVDHMDGAHSFKLKKDDEGKHHYIPLSWVKAVDDRVHIDRPGAQAMREWLDSPLPTHGGSSDGASDD